MKYNTMIDKISQQKYGGNDTDNKDNEEDMNESGEDSVENEVLKDATIELMKKNYSHPEPDDPNIQYKLYKKREYYYSKIPARPDITDNTDYSVIKDYRDNTCGRKFTLHEHQGMLSNVINPDTPYKGIIVYHGLGSGKCIHKDSRIMINGKTIKISNLWELSYLDFENITMVDDEGGEWRNCVLVNGSKLKIQSYDEEKGKMIYANINRLYREKVNTRLKEITLESGNKIIITQIHRLLTKDGWNNNLSVNDHVAVPVYIPVPIHVPLNLSPKVNKAGNDGIRYEKIISIGEIEYNDYVYDLEVEKTHNYVAEGIICHNTCVGVSIAEKFKPMVQKYNTKIYILVPGPILKESWRSHLLKCTGETYIKYQDKYAYMDEAEKGRMEKQALAQALQYYRIMSYRSFYKRVLGEKVVDKKFTQGNKTKTTYRKNKEGEFERDLAVDRIYNLNNTVIIVDEAHNLTGNAYGKALEKIIRNSLNLKVVLMSATLMKNLGSDIIELVNYLRPEDSPMERDKIFNSYTNHLMDFKPNGLEYFKNMINGYVSHVRGSDPLTFAKRIDKGEIPKGLQFTNVIRCLMKPFQRQTYDNAVKDLDDALDRASEAVANMSFPGLSNDRKSLTGYYGREGLNIVKEQLKVSSELLNKKISEMFGGIKNDQEWIYLTQDGKTITGRIYKARYLKHFSIKFYKSMKKLGRLVAGKKGAQTAFVYSNLVKVGIDVFQEILLKNGYMEYQEDVSNYQISPSTLCYYCGKKYKEHSRMKRMARVANELDDNTDTNTDTNTDISTDTVTKSSKTKTNIDIDISDSSTEYSPKHLDNLGVVNNHKFYPATFVSITGKSSEEKAEMINEDKKRILDNVFNITDNKEGRLIKFVLGSKVMNEGISMRNVGVVHVLDVYFNLGKVDQVVGRAIRWCSHYSMMSEKNVWPYVNVYKYVVSLDKDGITGLSSEEDLYRKAELKYVLINKLERAMKERAFDCPLNINGNIFNEEVRKYEKCDMHGDVKCPAICNYAKCEYKCDDPKLNFEYYDPNRKIYKAVKKSDIDYSTFTHGLAESEIEYTKNKIKNMFITNPVYTLRDIVDYVKNTYNDEKRELFDEFFVYKALDSLIPVTENDFNNFKDTVVDKNNTQGYIIYRGEHYIFQPFDQNEDVPLYYRVNDTKDTQFELSLYNYLKNNEGYKKAKTMKKKTSDKSKTIDDETYNFGETNEYYDTRDEFEIVGIIDKEQSRKKNKLAEEINDTFKIRPKLSKVLDKKRGTGIPSQMGAVCATSKSKEYLENTAKLVGANLNDNMTRTQVCSAIEHAMLEKEKYSTDKEKNKLTYIRIPSNHPKYPFPYNLEDRVRYYVAKIRSEVKHAIELSTQKDTVKSGPNKGKPIYSIVIKKKPQLDEYANFFAKLGATVTNDSITLTFE